jgi:hypothetical protein
LKKKQAHRAAWRNDGTSYAKVRRILRETPASVNDRRRPVPLEETYKTAFRSCPAKVAARTRAG